MIAFWPFLLLPMVITSLLWAPNLIEQTLTQQAYLPDLPKIHSPVDIEILEKEKSSEQFSFDLTKLMVGLSGPKLVKREDTLVKPEIIRVHEIHEP